MKVVFVLGMPLAGVSSVTKALCGDNVRTCDVDGPFALISQGRMRCVDQQEDRSLQCGHTPMVTVVNHLMKDVVPGLLKGTPPECLVFGGIIQLPEQHRLMRWMKNHGPDGIEYHAVLLECSDRALLQQRRYYRSSNGASPHERWKDNRFDGRIAWANERVFRSFEYLRREWHAQQHRVSVAAVPINQVAQRVHEAVFNGSCGRRRPVPASLAG